MDLDSGVGKAKQKHVDSQIEGESLGEFNRAKENTVGMLVRSFLENWKMLLPMTARSLEPTFYSVANESSSSIDHIAVPLSAWSEGQLKCRASVWLRSGRRLQLIKSAALADHMPVALTM